MTTREKDLWKLFYIPRILFVVLIFGYYIDKMSFVASVVLGILTVADSVFEIYSWWSIRKSKIRMAYVNSVMYNKKNQLYRLGIYVVGLIVACLTNIGIWFWSIALFLYVILLIIPPRQLRRKIKGF